MARIKGVPGGQATRAASPAAGCLGRIGAWCSDHRRSVLLGWIIGVIAIIAVASAAGSRFRDDFGGIGQSGQASSILAQRFPAQAGDAAQVVFRSSGPVRSPRVTARAVQALAAIRPLPSVTSVSPLVTAADGHTALATIQFDGDGRCGSWETRMAYRQPGGRR